MSCCTHEGANLRYRQVLWAVIALNGAMFGVELLAGAVGHSQALRASALDFLGDALSYGLSLWVLGKSPRWRAGAALLKALGLAALALWVLLSTLWRVFVVQLPAAEVMGAVAVLAFCCNLASVLLLVAYREGDANMRSVWLCSRNDTLGDLAVLLAAAGVWESAHAWPDLLVAGVMAGLFLSSALQIARRALKEWQSTRETPQFSR